MSTDTLRLITTIDRLKDRLLAAEFALSELDANKTHGYWTLPDASELALHGVLLKPEKRPLALNWQGNLIFAVLMIIPLIGCALAVYFKEPNWLVLLAPLIVLMEGAFLVGPLLWFVTMCLIEWRA